MTWLYVPGTSSPAVQASEDSNSAFCSPSAIGERMGEVYVTWRGKPQPPQAWSRRWKQGGFIRRLSGLTCEPSTLERGVASFISSLQETPARTTPSPESAPEQRESASSPPKSPALPKSAGLILSSARTSRGTRTDSSRPSLRHWKEWATALRQEYSARPLLPIPCGASDCSLWPSPMAGAAGTDAYNAAGNSDFSRKAMEQAEALIRWAAPKVLQGGANSNREARGAGGPDLQEQAQQWEAPSVAVTGGSRMTRSGDRSDELLLTGQAMEAAGRWAAQWPGPAARDFKGVNREVPTPDYNARPLNEVAADFLPPSSLDRPIVGGSTCSTDSPNSNQPSVRRKLNPIFVEALMRWPTGLSGFERQETAWTRWWLLMPSFLSALYSASEAEEQMDLFGGLAA